MGPSVVATVDPISARETRADSCSKPQCLAHRTRRPLRRLIDAAAFFGAVRQAALQARHSILIMGWDIDSRTRLVGESGEPEDAIRPSWRAFLGALVASARHSRCCLLLWDYSLLYATEREPFPLAGAAVEDAARACTSASTTRCRSAPPSIRRSSSSTDAWLSLAAWI